MYLQYLQGSSNGILSDICFDLFIQWYVFDIQYAQVYMVTKIFILDMHYGSTRVFLQEP